MAKYLLEAVGVRSKVEEYTGEINYIVINVDSCIRRQRTLVVDEIVDVFGRMKEGSFSFDYSTGSMFLQEAEEKKRRFAQKHLTKHLLELLQNFTYESVREWIEGQVVYYIQHIIRTVRRLYAFKEAKTILVFDNVISAESVLHEHQRGIGIGVALSLFEEVKDKTSLEINDLKYKYMLELDLSDGTKYREMQTSIVTKLQAMRQEITNRNMSDIEVLKEDFSAIGTGRAASRISAYIKDLQSSNVLICDQEKDAIGLYLTCRPKHTILMISSSLYRIEDYLEALQHTYKLESTEIGKVELLFKSACYHTLPVIKKLNNIKPEHKLAAALLTIKKIPFSSTSLETTQEGIIMKQDFKDAVDFFVKALVEYEPNVVSKSASVEIADSRAPKPVISNIESLVTTNYKNILEVTPVEMPIYGIYLYFVISIYENSFDEFYLGLNAIWNAQSPKIPTVTTDHKSTRRPGETKEEETIMSQSYKHEDLIIPRLGEYPEQSVQTTIQKVLTAITTKTKLIVPETSGLKTIDVLNFSYV